MNRTTQSPVITVRHLTKRYGDAVAVNDISFEVLKGEIFGIVGPNGAGKTSALESIMGLRVPFEGEVRVLGMDPQRQRTQVAERIGIQLQEAQLPFRLKVWEILDLFSSFFQKTVPYEPLLKTWGIWDKRDDPFIVLSGGQKQRVFIALALLNDPEAVFLDELTTGLDPQARRQTWELVQQIRDQGKTVVLVTHFMEEAQTLCDRVAIIDDGRIVALDTPNKLLNQIDGQNGVLFDDQPQLDVAELRALPAVDRVEQANGVVQAFGSADNLVSSVVIALEQQQIPIRNLRTVQPTLDDVFIALTGKELRD